MSCVLTKTQVQMYNFARLYITMTLLWNMKHGVWSLFYNPISVCGAASCLTWSYITWLKNYMKKIQRDTVSSSKNFLHRFLPFRELCSCFWGWRWCITRHMYFLLDSYCVLVLPFILYIRSTMLFIYFHAQGEEILCSILKQVYDLGLS